MCRIYYLCRSVAAANHTEMKMEVLRGLCDYGVVYSWAVVWLWLWCCVQLSRCMTVIMVSCTVEPLYDCDYGVVYSWAAVWLFWTRAQQSRVAHVAASSDHISTFDHYLWWLRFMFIDYHWIRWTSFIAELLSGKCWEFCVCWSSKQVKQSTVKCAC